MTKIRMIIAASLMCFVSPVMAMDGDVEAGAKVFKKCAACHIVDEAKNKAGPHLVGILDRPVASVEGFKYSKAMVAFAEENKVWDETLLKDYIAKPRSVVKGTRMAFAGLKKEEDLINIIAYLKTFPASE